MAESPWEMREAILGFPHSAQKAGTPHSPEPIYPFKGGANAIIEVVQHVSFTPHETSSQARARNLPLLRAVPINPSLSVRSLTFNPRFPIQQPLEQLCKLL